MWGPSAIQQSDHDMTLIISRHQIYILYLCPKNNTCQQYRKNFRGACALHHKGIHFNEAAPSQHGLLRPLLHHCITRYIKQTDGTAVLQLPGKTTDWYSDPRTTIINTYIKKHLTSDFSIFAKLFFVRIHNNSIRHGGYGQSQASKRVSIGIRV